MANPKSKFSKFFNAGNKAWKTTKTVYDERFGGAEVNSGDYIGRITSNEFAVINDKLYVERKFLILEDPYKGVTVKDIMNPTHETGGTYFRRYLDILGVPQPDALEELEEVFAAITKQKPMCKFNVKQGDYTNISLTSLVEDDGTNVQESSADADAGDEVELDDMDQEQLLEIIAEEKLTHKELGFKNKVKLKKASAEELRAALNKLYNENKEEEPAAEPEGSDDLLERAKVFAQVQGLDVEDDYDLDDMKDIIGDEKYVRKELNKDDKALLKDLDLKKCIVTKK